MERDKSGHSSNLIHGEGSYASLNQNDQSNLLENSNIEYADKKLA